MRFELTNKHAALTLHFKVNLLTKVFFFFFSQRWKKELAKNREKLFGDKDREKDRKATEQKDKDERKERREVLQMALSRKCRVSV